MDTQIFETRLAAVRAELSKKLQTREVLTAQLNQLIGREAELVELLQSFASTPPALREGE